MTSGEALDMVKTVAKAYGFRCDGDAIHCLAGLLLDTAEVNEALADPGSCTASPRGWRVRCTAITGDVLDVDLQLSPFPLVLSLGHARG